MYDVNDIENWDWELYPAGWYATYGFVGPQCGSWARYVEADKKAKEDNKREVQINERNNY